MLVLDGAYLVGTEPPVFRRIERGEDPGARDRTGAAECPTPEHVALTWARRLKRVFGIDIERCARRGEAAESDREHLGKSGERMRRSHPSVRVLRVCRSPSARDDERKGSAARAAGNPNRGCRRCARVTSQAWVSCSTRVA